MKRKALAFIVMLLLSVLIGIQLINNVKAETLGPLLDRSEELNVIGVMEIISPQNITYATGEILLNFTLIYEGQDYDVGYSMDGGAIERISVSKISEEPAYRNMPPYVRVTCVGTIILKGLSEGSHNVTVYGGYYYEGINQRYEVFKRAMISFSVDNSQPQTSSTPSSEPTYSPMPTPTEEPPLSVDPNFGLYTGIALLIILFAGVAVFLLMRKHKQ